MNRLVVFGLVLGFAALSARAQERIPCQNVERVAPTSSSPLGPPPDELTQIDGIWIGKLEGLSAPGYFEGCEWDLPLRIEIDGEEAIIKSWLSRDQSWGKPARASVVRRATNALVYFIDQAEPGNWVETWSVAVTMKDKDTLLVYWTRVVNNYGLDTTEAQSRYAFVSAGEFNRTVD